MRLPCRHIALRIHITGGIEVDERFRVDRAQVVATWGRDGGANRVGLCKIQNLSNQQKTGPQISHAPPKFLRSFVDFEVDDFA